MSTNEPNGSRSPNPDPTPADIRRGQVWVRLGDEVPAGKPLDLDLTRAIHLLVAGQSGSGKTLLLRSLIAQLISTYPPEDLGLVLIDPKLGVDLGLFNVSHLLCPVVEDGIQIPPVLQALLTEVDRRYRMMKAAGFAHFPAWQAAGAKLPFIAVVIEEAADLLATRRECAGYLVRLAQKGRAAGVILVMATQQNSVRSIPSLLLANLPTRVCFRVTNRTNSLMVLDACGAEQLAAVGEFLARSPAFSGLWHGQAFYLDPATIAAHIEQAKRYSAPSWARIGLPIPRPQGGWPLSPAKAPKAVGAAHPLRTTRRILKAILVGIGRLLHVLTLLSSTLLAVLEWLLIRINRRLQRRRPRWKIRSSLR